MTQAREFARKVAETTVYTANTVQRVMEAIAHEIYSELKDGRAVEFPGVGRFYAKRVPPKKYTHPKTKVKSVSKSKKIAAFKPLPRKKVVG